MTPQFILGLLLGMHRRGDETLSECMRASRHAAVYCIDAPDTMPAGGMYQDSAMDVEGEILFPMPLTFEREEQKHG